MCQLPCYHLKEGKVYFSVYLTSDTFPNSTVIGYHLRNLYMGVKNRSLTKLLDRINVACWRFLDFFIYNIFSINNSLVSTLFEFDLSKVRLNVHLMLQNLKSIIFLWFVHSLTPLIELIIRHKFLSNTIYCDWCRW